jgi:hypothetical protein
MHPADPLVPEPRSFEVEIATEKLKRYKFLGIYQIFTEPIYIGNRLRCEIHKHIKFFGIKNCHRNGRNPLLQLFMKRVVQLTVVITDRYHCYKMLFIRL